MRGIVLPNDFFLVRDKDGLYHWYSEDPLKSKNRDAAEIAIESVISEAVGWGDVANPVVVRINCAKIDRSVAFNVGLLASVRKGVENKHFEDMSGNIIDILDVQNTDRDFPLSAAVYNCYGDAVELRKYSFNGECKDGREEHHLLAINGPAVFKPLEQEDAPEQEAEEGE